MSAVWLSILATLVCATTYAWSDWGMEASAGYRGTVDAPSVGLPSELAGATEAFRRFNVFPVIIESSGPDRRSFPLTLMLRPGTKRLWVGLTYDSSFSFWPWRGFTMPPTLNANYTSRGEGEISILGQWERYLIRTGYDLLPHEWAFLLRPEVALGIARGNLKVIGYANAYHPFLSGGEYLEFSNSEAWSGLAYELALRGGYKFFAGRAYLALWVEAALGGFPAKERGALPEVPAWHPTWLIYGISLGF